MAITNDDLERVRHQLELKINSVSVEHVHLVQAIGSYGERFTAGARAVRRTNPPATRLLSPLAWTTLSESGQQLSLE